MNRSFFPILFALVAILCISCGNGDDKLAETNRNNTTGVDYRIPYHVKHVMDIPHKTNLESYYSVNIKADSVNNAQRDSINVRMIRICDSLKDHWNEAVITVMKETEYTNRLSEEKGITDSMNPYYDYNAYLLQYTFRDTMNVYVLKYDPATKKWKE